MILPALGVLKRLAERARCDDQQRRRDSTVMYLLYSTYCMYNGDDAKCDVPTTRHGERLGYDSTVQSVLYCLYCAVAAARRRSTNLPDSGSPCLHQARQTRFKILPDCPRHHPGQRLRTVEKNAQRLSPFPGLKVQDLSKVQMLSSHFTVPAIQVLRCCRYVCTVYVQYCTVLYSTSNRSLTQSVLCSSGQYSTSTVRLSVYPGIALRMLGGGRGPSSLIPKFARSWNLRSLPGIKCSLSLRCQSWDCTVLYVLYCR